MGVTGELVKSVFSKSRSWGTHDNIVVRSNAVEKRRWSSVRSYLCGDEFNSVLAEDDSASFRSSKATAAYTQHEFSSAVLPEEDSASVRSSEATVTQPILEDLADQQEIQSIETKDKNPIEKHNSTAKLFRKEDAAIVIQSAFRSFLARRRGGGGSKLAADTKELIVGTASPSRESIGTSIEGQTANSTEAFSLIEESIVLPHQMQLRARTQVLKIQEDWDDSTVSSNISKMRVRNRLEAAIRRERALAYAFSLQLRICSKKKQTRSAGTEPNMGWSWLERWMATRQPDSFLIDNDVVSKQLEPPNGNQSPVARKRLLDVAKEEKESCGSNEVSIQLDSSPLTTWNDKRDPKPAKNRLKASRRRLRQKTLPKYHYAKENSKVNKKDWGRDDETGKKQKTKPSRSKSEIKSKAATSQVSPDV